MNKVKVAIEAAKQFFCVRCYVLRSKLKRIRSDKPFDAYPFGKKRQQKQDQKQKSRREKRVAVCLCVCERARICVCLIERDAPRRRTTDESSAAKKKCITRHSTTGLGQQQNINRQQLESATNICSRGKERDTALHDFRFTVLLFPFSISSHVIDFRRQLKVDIDLLLLQIYIHHTAHTPFLL